jgi:hypothetical protein
MSVALTLTVTVLKVGMVLFGQPAVRARAEGPAKSIVICPYGPSLEIEGAQEKKRAATMIPIATIVLLIMRRAS